MPIHHWLILAGTMAYHEYTWIRTWAGVQVRTQVGGKNKLPLLGNWWCAELLLLKNIPDRRLHGAYRMISREHATFYGMQCGCRPALPLAETQSAVACAQNCLLATSMYIVNFTLTS